MSTLQHAWLGNYEINSVHCTGLTFARHSHDECVIGVNLVGEEKVWLDRQEFEAGPGSITLYNPGQIQGGGAADGAPWQFVSLYVSANQLACDLGLAQWSSIDRCVSSRISHGAWRLWRRAHLAATRGSVS
jgi:AraC family chemosensory pili system transcriptional regulator ChpD